MLEARSVALVGASPRPGSLGERMVAEVGRSPSRPRTFLVNPGYDQIGGQPCHRRLDDVPDPVDLVLLAVPDAALEDQLALAAARGDRSAVIFGSAYDVPGRPPGLRARLAALAGSAGMALCGAGCMGLVNVARGLRAIGYLEPDPLPAGPVALVTHSGSVFSALLRSRRGFGFSAAVSSGQELVTTAAEYARYALTLPETRVLALVLEAIRDAGLLRAVLADAAAADVPVVLLTAGGSARGRTLVSAHSGALAAGDGAWEALAGAYGVHRVHDLAELADTLEIFSLRPRPAQAANGAGPRGGGAPPRDRGEFPADIAGNSPRLPVRGIATVHDSGLERAHVVDLAAELSVPFGRIGERARARLRAVLDPGLEAGNPLDMWGTGRDAEGQLTEALSAMADDPAVAAVALAVDLVPEFDGDRSYQDAVLAAARRTVKPVVVLANLPSAIDREAAAGLRGDGVPVLEGTRSGLLALRHLLDHQARADRAAAPPAAVSLTSVSGPSASGPSVSGPSAPGVLPGTARSPTGPALPGAVASPVAAARRRRWAAALAGGDLGGATLLDLLRDYGIPAVRARPAASRGAVLAAATWTGYPVVLKTDEPGIAHKSDVGGVVTGLGDPAALAAAYEDLAARLGPRALVCQTAAPGTELALGLTRDPALGPLIVVGAGGVLVELLADRAVALPPVERAEALRLVGSLGVAKVLAGARGRPPADLDAIADTVAALSVLAADLEDVLEALDVNPLICGPSGAVAVDALAVTR